MNVAHWNEYQALLKARRALQGAEVTEECSNAVTAVSLALRIHRGPHNHASPSMMERLTGAALEEWRHGQACAIFSRTESDGYIRREKKRGGRTWISDPNGRTQKIGVHHYRVRSAHTATGMGDPVVYKTLSEFKHSALLRAEAPLIMNTGAPYWTAGVNVSMTASLGARRLMNRSLRQDDPHWRLPFIGVTAAVEDVMIFADVTLRRGYGYCWVKDGSLMTGINPREDPRANLALSQWYFGASRFTGVEIVRFGWTQQQALSRCRDAIRAHVDGFFDEPNTEHAESELPF